MSEDKNKELLNGTDEEKEKPAFTLKRGNKKYPVFLHFKNEGEENINTKLKKMLEKAVKDRDF